MLSLTGAVLPAGLAADDHLVSPAELRREIGAAQQARERDIRAVTGLFAVPPAAKALRAGGMDPAKVEKAVSALDDATLAKLAARAATAQRDLAAGALSNEHLTYIVIALATAIIVILAT